MNKATLSKELARVRRASGHRKLQAEDVVADARSETSPLHPLFEWNDSKAAHEYRLERARELIRSVEVIITHDKREVRVVEYVSSPVTYGRGYSLVKTISRKDEQKAILRRELQTIAGLIDRTRGLAAAFGLADELQKMLAKLCNLADGLDEGEEAA